jgi:hypothetical protein
MEEDDFEYYNLIDLLNNVKSPQIGKIDLIYRKDD